jgi:hypothetical protein
MKLLLILLILANLLAFAWISQHDRSEPADGQAEFAAIPSGLQPLQLLSEREVDADIHLAATEPDGGSLASVKRQVSEAEAETDNPAEAAGESESEAEPDVAAEAEPVPPPPSLPTDTRSREAEPVPPPSSLPTDTRPREAQPPEPPVPVEVCQSIGPFVSEEVLNEGVAWLKEHDRRGQVRSEKVKEQTGYWVYLPAMAPELAEQITDELEEKGVKDYYRGRRNEISLGIYSREDVAERRRQQIVALGYEPVLAPRFRNRRQYWIDLREMQPEVLTDAEWAEYLVNHPNVARQSAECR